MNKLRMAVLGCGHIGHRHIAMIQANPEMELVAVADVRPAEECDAPAGVPFFRDIDLLMAKRESVGGYDVVCICTPNETHPPFAALVLSCGVNALVEKPLALDSDSIDILRSQERKFPARLFCVFQNRQTPTAKWLHDTVRFGKLGRLTSIVVNCFWNRDERYYKPGGWHGDAVLDGGTLFTQYSHFIDLLLWVVGPVDVFAADFDDFTHQDLTDFEDSGAFLFRTREDKAIGSFSYSTVTPVENFECSMTLIGTRGSIRMGGPYMSELQHFQIPGEEAPVFPPAPVANDYGGYKGSAANHALVFQNLADVLLRGAEPVATLEDGAATTALIERVYSFRRGNFSRKPKRVRR